MRALSRKPLRGHRRIAAILDIDKMAFGAADLFLKTVEEPPLNTHIVLTTSRPDLLMPTLLSRTHQIKMPVAPHQKLEEYLSPRLGISGVEVSYLARISGGSPGMAIHLFESDITQRRDLIMAFFEELLKRADTNMLVDRVNRRYGLNRISYDDLRLDFDIMESIIHDLYLSRENRLDNHIINVDIKKKLSDLGCPDLEVLDIWKTCCAETRQACLVNNVTAGTGMIFFYISCAGAVRNQSGPKFKLP
jgi:DNA polymerase-3 subunit delta'